MRAYVVRKGASSFEGLEQTTLPDPTCGPKDVKIRVRATSLNYRDQMIPLGKYFTGPVSEDTIPLSDGAGEVVECGAEVSRVKKGDRVAGAFFQGWIDGPPRPGPMLALGAPPATGMLAEYVVLDEDGVVKLPDSLTFEEAACLPCAGVTAWNALNIGKQVSAGDTVLCLGTGGVSMLALLIAKAAGARVVITSSSDDKLARAKDLGADIGINYSKTPEWSAAVLEATGGLGADIVVEVGGAGTLAQSMHAAAFNGAISLIGVLTTAKENASAHALMLKGASLRGVFVGNRAMFEALLRACDINGIKPPIDKTFSFDEARAAYEYQSSKSLFGKVAITV